MQKKYSGKSQETKENISKEEGNLKISIRSKKRKDKKLANLKIV